MRAAFSTVNIASLRSIQELLTQEHMRASFQLLWRRCRPAFFSYGFLECKEEGLYQLQKGM